MALKLGTVTWNYPACQPTNQLFGKQLACTDFGRGVTDFVRRKLHENTIKATEQQPIHFLERKNLGLQIYIFKLWTKVRRAGSDVVCPVRKCGGKHLGPKLEGD